MDEKNKEKSIILALLLVAQVIFIIVIVSIIVLNSKNERIEQANYDRQPFVEIENIKTQLPSIPDEYSRIIEQVLAETIALNTEEYSMSNSKATIREGTFNALTFESINSVYYNAIIDIPDLQQSYQVYAAYSINEKEPSSASYYTRYILCQDNYSEKIYPDFDCQDLYGADARRIIVSKYLDLFSFEYFSPYLKDNDLSTIYINPINSQIDETTKESYIQETKNAVSSLGISPELFSYNILIPNASDYYIPPEDR